MLPTLETGPVLPGCESLEMGLKALGNGFICSSPLPRRSVIVFTTPVNQVAYDHLFKKTRARRLRAICSRSHWSKELWGPSVLGSSACAVLEHSFRTDTEVHLNYAICWMYNSCACGHRTKIRRLGCILCSWSHPKRQTSTTRCFHCFAWHFLTASGSGTEGGDWRILNGRLEPRLRCHPVARTQSWFNR